MAVILCVCVISFNSFENTGDKVKIYRQRSHMLNISDQDSKTTKSQDGGLYKGQRCDQIPNLTGFPTTVNRFFKMTTL